VDPNREYVYPVWSVLVLVAPGLLDGLFAWLFLARTDWLLDRLLSNVRVAPPALPFGHLQSLAFSVVGVALIAQSLPSLAGVVVASELTAPGAEYGLRTFARENYQSLVYSLARLAIGLYLFLGARGLVTVWHRLHPVATREREPRDPDQPAG